MRIIILVTALSMLTVGSSLNGQSTPRPSMSVVGTWRLESQEVRRADTGAVDEERTPDQVIGRLTYDGSGQMAVQIDRRAWDPTYPYMSYFGTYSVNELEGVVVHHVQTSTVDAYAGTDQRREFELQDSGQTLIIRNRRFTRESDPVEILSRLIWRRLN